MISRRSFCWTAAIGSLAWAVRSRGQTKKATARRATEWSYSSGKAYDDPFNNVTLDMVVTGPDGQEQRVPAFWAGEQLWRVRYVPPKPGRYQYRTVCSDRANVDLHERSGTLEVEPYQGDNPLYKHGPIRVAADRRHFEHADGTPFFWLGDTWWMGLCRRLRWPEDFQQLTADRVKKGFTVIQIVAGLYPDMPAFDARGFNEAGHPWEKDYARINPAYFDMADLRIRYLVESGLMPCVVAAWGYHLPWMGVEKVKAHWRNLIARWGAYPVVWCLAGEGTMPYYLSQNREEEMKQQKQGWTEVGRYVREIDPYHHVVTIHPSGSARETVADPSVLDFDMLQTGHSDRASIPNTVQRVTQSLTESPKMPVLNGEVCYEGILEHCREEMQRFMFWSCMLSGAAGHTYGANGIWQINTAGKPFGPSPHGRSWGDRPWDEASQLPGSLHLGKAKALLMRYPWWKFEPHPEWVEPHWTQDNYVQPFAAGIPKKVRLVYMPWMWNFPKVKQLEEGVSYRAFLFDPSTGEEHSLGLVTADATGSWELGTPHVVRDWVLVLEAQA